MSQIRDLDLTELERTLPGQLRRSADAATPEPDALAAVRARAAGRRRRSRMTMFAASAAAVAVIATGVVMVTGNDPSTGITAGPADGAPSTVTAPVPAEALDATLVIYRYPDATAEMIAQDPRMGGEWATLLTSDRRYHANGPLDELGANSPSETSDVVRAFMTLDSLQGQDAALVIAALDAGPSAGVPVPTVAPVQPETDQASAFLIGLLMSGATDAPRAAELRRLLESLPGMTIDDGPDGVTVTAPAGGWVTYDPATGHPLRSGWTDAPESDTEYVSITRVRAVDVLVPGRGTPNSVSTTTTTVPG